MSAVASVGAYTAFKLACVTCNECSRIGCRLHCIASGLASIARVDKACSKGEVDPASRSESLNADCALYKEPFLHCPVRDTTAVLVELIGRYVGRKMYVCYCSSEVGVIIYSTAGRQTA